RRRLPSGPRDQRVGEPRRNREAVEGRETLRTEDGARRSREANGRVAAGVGTRQELAARMRQRTQAVPPTVSPSILSVGCPTPTGTLCPSLPQVPTPVSSARSLPIMETRVSTSGPLPIRVAPFTG